MNVVQARLSADMKAAMKAGEKDRLGVIRLLIAALQEQHHRSGSDELSEDAELDVLRKQVKLRRDSIEQAEAVNRQEIADKERAEIDIIQGYLPQMLTGDALLEKVREVAAEVAYSGPQDVGKFMKGWMAQYKGAAEGRDVQAALKTL